MELGMELNLAGVVLAAMVHLTVEWRASVNNFQPRLKYLILLAISGLFFSYTLTVLILPEDAYWMKVFLTSLGGSIAPVRSLNHYQSWKRRSL